MNDDSQVTERPADPPSPRTGLVLVAFAHRCGVVLHEDLHDHVQEFIHEGGHSTDDLPFGLDYVDIGYVAQADGVYVGEVVLEDDGPGDWPGSREVCAEVRGLRPVSEEEWQAFLDNECPFGEYRASVEEPSVVDELERLRCIETAARALCTWDPVPHGEDCAHRHCEDCEDGACEETDQPCTCSRAAEDALRRALKGSAKGGARPEPTKPELEPDYLAQLKRHLQYRLGYGPSAAELVQLGEVAERIDEIERRRAREAETLAGMKAGILQLGGALGPIFAKWAERATAKAGIETLVNAANSAVEAIGLFLYVDEDPARVLKAIHRVNDRQLLDKKPAELYDAAIDALCRLRLALRERELAAGKEVT